MKRDIDMVRGAIAALLGLLALALIIVTMVGALESPPEWTGYPGPDPYPYPAAGDPYPVFVPVEMAAPTLPPNYP